MYVAAELAEFYRKNFIEPSRHVHAKAWIDAHPDALGVVLLATVNATIEDISMAPLRLPEAIALDMMKLGTGAADGSKLGIAEDVLRLLNVIPAGRVVQGTTGIVRPFLGRIAQTVTNFLRWRHYEGQLCAPIAFAQAMQRTGTRLVVSLEEYAKAAKKSIPTIFEKGANPSDTRAALKALSANFREVPAGTVRTWQALVTQTARTEGVVALSLRATVEGKNIGHVILVGKTSQGVKIFDRYGVFSSLDDLSRHYGLIGADRTAFVINETRPLFVIRNWALDPALANKLNALGALGAVIVRGAAILTLAPGVTPATLQKSFDAFLADRNAGPLPPNPSPGPPPASDVMAMHYVQAQGAMLSKVSMSYYGTHHMWPLIWDANRELIGPNPNRVPKDIYLKILKPHVYSSAQIAEAKRRSLNWKSFN